MDDVKFKSEELLMKQELSCWYLFGVSEAARKKHCIQLKVGDNYVGKSSAHNSVVLPSKVVSRQHCNLVASDSEVILRDNSGNGTYVNGIQYKQSRQILCHEDLIGFGSTTTRQDDKTGKFVYRLRYCQNFEFDTIALDEGYDDYDVDDLDNVKNIPKIIGAPDEIIPINVDDIVEILDSDEEKEHENDFPDLYTDFNDTDDETNTPSEAHTDLSTGDKTERSNNHFLESQAMIHRDIMMADLAMPTDINPILITEIKQEINDLSYSYDRVVATKKGEIIINERNMVSIDLISDDEDQIVAEIVGEVPIDGNDVSRGTGQCKTENDGDRSVIDNETNQTLEPEMFNALATSVPLLDHDIGCNDPKSNSIMPNEDAINSTAKRKIETPEELSISFESSTDEKVIDEYPKKKFKNSTIEPIIDSDLKYQGNKTEPETFLTETSATNTSSKAENESKYLNLPPTIPAKPARFQMPKVKLCFKSRGFQLAEDMLASTMPKSAATMSTDSAEVLNYAKAIPNVVPKIECQPSSLGSKVSDQVAQLAIENELEQSNISWDHRNIICDITKWKPDWVKNVNKKNYSGPVFGQQLQNMTEEFETLHKYQSTIIPLMKSEIWHTLVLSNKQEIRKHIFLEMEEFQLTKMERNLTQYSCTCITKSNNEEVKKHFASGDLLIVTLSRGRFFAFLVAIHSLAQNTVQFRIRSATNIVTEELFAKSKYLSIKSVINLNIEMACFNQLAQMHKFPLYENILHPAINVPAITPSLSDYDNNKYEFYLMDDHQTSVLNELFGQTMHTIENDRPLIQLVDGAAGTGKTEMLIVFALQLLYCANKRDLRILLCAANNVALDYITKKLVHVIDNMDVTEREKPTLVRFGRGTAIKNELKNVTVDFHTQDVHKQRMLKKANIVCTTLPGSSLLYRLCADDMDICILDDASSYGEQNMLCIYTFAFRTLIMFGDMAHQPLVTYSEIAREHGLTRTLFKRILNCTDKIETPIAHHRLTQQYRMHPELCKWPNRQFYNNRIEYSDLTIDNDFVYFSYAVVSLTERSLRIKSNEDELTFTMDFVQTLTTYTHPDRYTIGIITPHMDIQMGLEKALSELNRHVKNRIEVNSVDYFQGDQKDVILILLPQKYRFGPFKYEAAVRTAITRAKKLTIVIGNFELEKRADTDHNPWRSLISDANDRECLIEFRGDYVKEDIFSMLVERSTNH